MKRLYTGYVKKSGVFRVYNDKYRTRVLAAMIAFARQSSVLSIYTMGIEAGSGCGSDPSVHQTGLHVCFATAERLLSPCSFYSFTIMATGEATLSLSVHRHHRPKLMASLILRD